MKIGIIGAMEQEVALLAEVIENKKEWEEAGVCFYSGNLGQHEVVVTQSGIGKVLAGLTATLLISHYKVDCLINTGSAGGIGAGLTIGDVVISEKLAYFDADVTAFGYSFGQMPQMPLYFEANEKLIRFAKIAANQSNLITHSGLIVSGDTFVHSNEQIQQIKSHFPNVVANEMEGAAIAQVAYQYDCPFVVIRAISDVGDENASVNFDEFIIEAGKNSATMVLELIRNIND